jgi:hypothetical protein
LGIALVDKQEPFDKITYKIGRVVITFSTLDMALDWLIQAVMETKKEIRIATLTEMRFNDKIKLLHRLYILKHPDQEKDIEILVNSLHEIRSIRNKLMHSLWIVNIDRDFTIESRKKNKTSDLNTEKITEEYLDELLAKISASIKLLYVHLKRIDKGAIY